MQKNKDKIVNYNYSNKYSIILMNLNPERHDTLISVNIDILGIALFTLDFNKDGYGNLVHEGIYKCEKNAYKLVASISDKLKNKDITYFSPVQRAMLSEVTVTSIEQHLTEDNFDILFLEIINAIEDSDLNTYIKDNNLNGVTAYNIKKLMAYAKCSKNKIDNEIKSNRDSGFTGGSTGCYMTDESNEKLLDAIMEDSTEIEESTETEESADINADDVLCSYDEYKLDTEEDKSKMLTVNEVISKQIEKHSKEGINITINITGPITVNM